MQCAVWSGLNQSAMLQAPWILACTESLAMLLLYLLLTPHHPSHFRFTSSLDDVALFSFIRFVAVICAYLWGSGRSYHRYVCP